MSDRKLTSLTELIVSLRALPPLRTAVVYPCDKLSLSGLAEVAAARIIKPTAIGPVARIRELASSLGIDLSGIDVFHAADGRAAAERAVELVQNGQVDALMKGSLETDELMAAVVHKDSGIRTARRISHVFVIDLPAYSKLLLITDAAVNIVPTLEDKVDILQNAIELAHALQDGGPRPDYRSPVAGDPDILLVPDMESGNILVKEERLFAAAEAAGIVLGARVPVILTSRADNVPARIASCAVAALYTHTRRESAMGIGQF